MSKSELLSIIAFCTCLAGLILLSLAQQPEIHRDAQYYLQSAILWRDGRVTFAGSWIGSRHLAVWFYHLFFAIFGNSVDAVTLAVTTVKAFTAIAIAVFSWNTLPGRWLRPLVAASLSVLVFHAPVMTYPATDNIGMMMVAWAMALLSIARNGQAWIAVTFLPLVCGLAITVRSESFLLAIIVASLFLVQNIKRVSPHWLIAPACVVVGMLLPSILWPLWVPAEKPPTYGSAIGLYRPIAEFGRTDDGPASADIGRLLRLPPADRIPYWDAISASYVAWGPERSNAVLTTAGIEAIRQHWRPLVEAAVRDFVALLFFQGGVIVNQAPSSEVTATLRRTLAELDQVRDASSPKFGDDATYATEALLDERLPFLKGWQSNWTMYIQIQLPGALLIFGLVIAVLTAIKTRDLVWLAIPVFGLAVAALAATSQGMIPRYTETAAILNACWSIAALSAFKTYARNA